MAIHSSTISWKIPWTEEPGRLQSMGSQRVGCDRANSLHLSMAPPIRKRPSFPHSQPLSSGSFHKPLILINQRAERMKTTITGN